MKPTPRYATAKPARFVNAHPQELQPVPLSALRSHLKRLLVFLTRLCIYFANAKFYITKSPST